MKPGRTELLLMLASFGLALFFWYWVGGQERSEVIVSVPLEYRNLPKNLEILSDDSLVSKVNVWVKGTTATVKNLAPQEVSVWVDLDKTTAGERIFELNTENVKLPYGFSVLRISPSQLKVSVEEVVRRKVAVLPRLEGVAPAGYAIKKTIVSPPEVEIVGPQSEVSKVRHVITDSIDVSVMKSDTAKTVNVGVESNIVRLGHDKTVVVTLYVGEIEDMMTLRHIPVTITNAKGVARTNPKTVRVDLQAPKRLLTLATEENTAAILDVKELKPGLYELTPRIEFAPETAGKITVVEIIPERIKVRIE